MIKTDVTVAIGYNDTDIKEAICRTLPVAPEEIGEVRILRRTLRLGERKEYALSLGISFSAEREAGLLKMRKKVSECPTYEFSVPSVRGISPVIVGAGPAGLFAAILLAEAGLCPIVLERGDDIVRRSAANASFIRTRVLNEESNVQFGEGGAGAFSDGKLKFGSMDKYRYKVLSEFVSAGAPEDIIYTVGAHLGTDKLPGLVRSLRERAEVLGATFRFNTRVTDLDISSGSVRAVIAEHGGARERIETDTVIFAHGHSATDTFEMLLDHGVAMEARGFGVGVRIEHPREYIDQLVYGDASLAEEVGTASYHLVTHLPSGRSVYSFCMCPGGTVVAAASKNEGIVTNGMSEYMRDAENSNAAHLVSVRREDFGSDHPLAGFILQRRIESLAYNAGGADYSAPVTRMDAFLDDRLPDSLGGVSPSYPVGTRIARPEDYLPRFITDSLREGIRDFDKWMPGFYLPDAVLTGAETRSTSPVRIIRTETFCSPSVNGLYPVGEGAGYAGGIVSSAADALRVCESIILSKASIRSLK